MNIAFFTEMEFQGKISRTHNNMRVEFAWMCALKADHWNINQPPNQQYDLGIVIIPKNNPQFDINKLKQYCGIGKIIHYNNKYGITILYKKLILCLFIIHQIKDITKV